MKFQHFTFGQIRLDGAEYGYDVVIDRGEIRERKKKPSKRFRESFGHTPRGAPYGEAILRPVPGRVLAVDDR